MALLRNKPPVWFWIVAVIFALWGLMGIYAFYADITMGAAAKAQLSAYDRNLLASRPAWFPWLYGFGVWTGLFGAVALLLRSAYANILTIVSLVLVIVMFGFIFVATDLIAVKGFGAAAGFPIFIVFMEVAQLWLAQRGIKRGWIA